MVMLLSCLKPVARGQLGTRRGRSGGKAGVLRRFPIPVGWMLGLKHSLQLGPTLGLKRGWKVGLRLGLQLGHKLGLKSGSKLGVVGGTPTSIYHNSRSTAPWRRYWY